MELVLIRVVAGELSAPDEDGGTVTVKDMKTAMMAAIRKAPDNHALVSMKGTGRAWKFQFQKVR